MITVKLFLLRCKAFFLKLFYYICYPYHLIKSFSKVYKIEQEPDNWERYVKRRQLNNELEFRKKREEAFKALFELCGCITRFKIDIIAINQDNETVSFETATQELLRKFNVLKEYQVVIDEDDINFIKNITPHECTDSTAIINKLQCIYQKAETQFFAIYHNP